eukprot:GHVH01004663.1.p2 GENE.GHVH01004663.1~~GHVH01004663.1.p2  ORF type:complete len:260 (+),score=67.79 GHVH01004663.1:94-780(+)
MREEMCVMCDADRPKDLYKDEIDILNPDFAVDATAEDVDATAEDGESSDESKPVIVYRDTKGNEISREEWEKLKKIDASTGKKIFDARAPQEKMPAVSWSKGVSAMASEAEREQYEREVAEQSFARYKFDDKYEKELKGEIREDDPLAFMFGGITKKTEEGEEMADNASTIKPAPMHQAPSNRFSISAGYRWDGVVRGTGFEERWLAARQLKRDQDEDWKMSMQEFRD